MKYDMHIVVMDAVESGMLKVFGIANAIIEIENQE